MTKYRCDEPMKRSKEQGYIRDGVHWKCNNNCKSCICCIVKDEYGNEHHIGAMKWERKSILNPID